MHTLLLHCGHAHVHSECTQNSPIVVVWLPIPHLSLLRTQSDLNHEHSQQLTNGSRSNLYHSRIPEENASQRAEDTSLNLPCVSQVGKHMYGAVQCILGSSQVTSSTARFPGGRESTAEGHPPRYLRAALQAMFHSLSKLVGSSQISRSPWRLTIRVGSHGTMALQKNSSSTTVYISNPGDMTRICTLARFWSFLYLHPTTAKPETTITSRLKSTTQRLLVSCTVVVCRQEYFVCFDLPSPTGLLFCVPLLGLLQVTLQTRSRKGRSRRGWQAWISCSQESI